MTIEKKLALAAFLAPVLLAGAAYAAEPGFYLGAGAGRSTLKADLDNGTEIDKDDTGYKAFLGYQFVPWLGLEGGYVELGSADSDRTLPNGNRIDGRLDVGGWEGYLVPSLPIGDHFEIFGKIGGFNGDVTADGKIRAPDGSTLSKYDQSSDNESMWAYGGGVAWNFGKGHWSLRAEYLDYDADNVDDLYMVSGSLVYRFFSDRTPAPAVAAAAPVVAAPPAACSDADNDGVCDTDDQCPNTPAGARVDAIGCGCDYSMQLEFAFDSAKLSASDMEQLDELASILANPKVSSIEGAVDGYTDSIGAESYNLGLSQRRAEAVANYLQSKGVNLGGRFSVHGYGEADPVASNDTAEGRAQNRRVVVRRTDCGK